jgi:hypothetical protein
MAARPHDALDERDLALLAFERDWEHRRGSKDAEIRSRFGVPTARYYQMLYSLLDSPAALAHDPLLVRRLLRLRERSVTARAARRRGVTTDQDRAS